MQEGRKGRRLGTLRKPSAPRARDRNWPSAAGTQNDFTTSGTTNVSAFTRNPSQEPASRHPRRAVHEFSFVDLFAGIGGIRLGLERAGGRCTYSVELDRQARRTYEANFGRVDHDDVTTVDPGEFGAYDVLAAGFPCQPFSIAGVSKKNSLGRPHGFADKVSGNLFFSIRDIVRHTRPSAVFLENVKNLMTHDDGRTWWTIKKELTQLGYRVTATIIDSSHWVPQRRRRTFIVALDENCFDHDFSFPAEPVGPGPSIGSILEPGVGAKYTLTPALWDYLERYAETHRGRGNGFGRGLITSADAVTRTLSARYYKDGSEILLQLDGAERPRRLTPIECGRLMGFPAPHHFDASTKPVLETPPLTRFRIPVSDWQAYRQFGNSVVVPVVEFVGRALAAEIAALRSRQNSRPR
jgi:DNA (cytosine-5)-methyltransferase 1